MLGQIQYVSLKGLGVCASKIGETNLDLTNAAAIETLDPRNLKIDEGRLATDRQATEGSHLFAFGYHIAAIAIRTSKMRTILGDLEKDRPLFEQSPKIAVPNDPKSVIQKAGGHPMAPFI
jgi:hypothetical protein